MRLSPRQQISSTLRAPNSGHRRATRMAPARTSPCPRAGRQEQQRFCGTAMQRALHGAAMPPCVLRDKSVRMPGLRRACKAEQSSQHRKKKKKTTKVLLLLSPSAAASASRQAWPCQAPAGQASAAPCCSLLLPPAQHRRASPLLPLSGALLFVRHGFDVGVPWPLLPAKLRDALIPAADSTPYPISLPATTTFYTQPHPIARLPLAPCKHSHPPGNSVTTSSFFIQGMSCI